MLCPTHLRVWLTLGLRLVTVTLALLPPRLCAEAGLAEALVTGWRVPPLQGSVAATHPLAEHNKIVRSRNRKFNTEAVPSPHPAALHLGSLCTSRSPGPPPGDGYHVVINILCIYTIYLLYIYISTWRQESQLENFSLWRGSSGPGTQEPGQLSLISGVQNFQFCFLIMAQNIDDIKVFPP